MDPPRADKGRGSLSSRGASLHEDRESSAPSAHSDRVTLHQPLRSAAPAGRTGPLWNLKHRGHPEGQSRWGAKMDSEWPGNAWLSSESPNACQGFGAAQTPIKSGTGTFMVVISVCSLYFFYF